MTLSHKRGTGPCERLLIGMDFLSRKLYSVSSIQFQGVPGAPAAFVTQVEDSC